MNANATDVKHGIFKLKPKRVRFDFSATIIVIIEDECRLNEIYLDRMRFLCRIERICREISWIFENELRKRIFRDRFGD